MKSILVTGGAGFIGSNFILECIEQERPYQLINLDLLTYAGNLENLKAVEGSEKHRFIKGDIGDQNIISRLLREHSITHIVHFAAESHVDRSIEGPGIFLQTNVMGTFNLLQCALEYWRETNQLDSALFLHVSTDEVFGSLGSQGLFIEETPYAPNSPYSASKASSDLLVRSYIHTFGLPAIITNCSNNYGPFQFPEKLLPLMINNIIQKKPLPVYGEGKNIRDWLYVRDHCRALITVLEKAAPGSRYNIGGRNEWANIDIVNLLCDLADRKLGRPPGDARKRICFVKDRPGHDLRYAIDASAIERDLGWVPEETFETGLEKTLDWYLANDVWLKNVTTGNYLEYYRHMYDGR